MYAGADLEHMPASDEDWRRLYFLRRLSERQRRMAFALGEKMAEAIRSGGLKPVTMDKMLPPALRWIMDRVYAVSPPYRLAE